MSDSSTGIHDLVNEVPVGEDPDLSRLTVEAAIGWVNQKAGVERERRFERVLSVVMPD